MAEEAKTETKVADNEPEEPQMAPRATTPKTETKQAPPPSNDKEAERLKGTVVWFNGKAGYGWINVENEQDDAYVHFSDIVSKGYKTLEDGAEVEFELIYQDEGFLKAIKVTGPDGAEINNDKKFGGGGSGKGGNYDNLNDSEVSTGRVISFKAENGYGWIECDDGSGDAYVHYSDIVGTGFRTLYANQIVEFKLIKQRGGDLKAVRVTGKGGQELNNDKKSRPRFNDFGGDGGDGDGDDDRMTGRCVSFKDNYGWISCDDGSGDAYVHYTEIIVDGDGYRKLEPGQIVEFTLIKQKGGRMKATQVTGRGGQSLDTGYSGRGGYGGRGRGGYGGYRGRGRGRGGGRGGYGGYGGYRPRGRGRGRGGGRGRGRFYD